MSKDNFQNKFPMLQHGLLVLNYGPANIQSLLSKVGFYFREVNLKISKTLYVSLEPKLILDTNKSSTNQLFCRQDLLLMIPTIYAVAHRKAPFLDVRILHHQMMRDQKNVNLLNFQPGKRKLTCTPQIVFTNEDINNEILKNYDIPEDLEIIMIDKVDSSEPANFKSLISNNIYDHVVLGGTFDNLHNGHKILLSTAQLKCNKSLTIGVTNEELLKNKILRELIDSTEKRIELLKKYLQDTDPYIEYKITEISDPFGPAIIDRSLQAIIVSEETIKGGEKINEIRVTKNMSKLDIDIIKLLQDDHNESDCEENKVSSSSLRMRKLGTLLKEPELRDHLPKKPYLIGLTGIICSGKSSISKKFEQLGAGIINVDLLAHKTYENSTLPGYKKIVETFHTDSSSILDEHGNIDRKKLGNIVFSDDSKLEQLNSIIWPEVYKLLDEEIEKMSTKYQVIILEIALLIESGVLINRVHQIWMTILDDKEVIERLKDRNNLTKEQAIQRINSMMPIKEKIKYANVVFCTKWDPEYTWKQVHKAWNMLKERKFFEEN